MGPQYFIKRPRFAFVISIVITFAGLLSLAVMPVDQYPDITAPKVVVAAQYPGASAETVLNTLAAPIEKQVNGAEGMVYMSSKSASDGSYTLTVTFEVGTDADMAQVDVQNRVALAEPQLPPETRQRGIRVRKRSPDMLMVVNLLSPDDRFDRVFLSNYASINVLPELARLSGVGEARIIGALDYGMRAWLDPVEMANRNVTVGEVVAALREQNVQAAVGQLGAAPSPEETQFQYVLTTTGRLETPEEFGDIVLRADESGSVIRLGDVSRIELGAEVYKAYGEFNNGPGVILAVYKLSDANALEVADRVRAKMDELTEYFPEGLEYAVGHDTTLFIRASLEETALTLLLTIIMVIAVTYIFLGSVRATLIPAVAVPVSVIGTLAVLYGLGMTINTVTLFALILAIGLVVDDAIIVVENVERLMAEKGLAPRPATEEAMRQVAGPIVATSLVLAAVFGPTMLLPGITGRMFAQFGATLVVAVLISSVNAMTLSPALAATILRHEGSGGGNPVVRGFNASFARLTTAYRGVVSRLAARPVLGAGLIVGLFALLVVLFRVTPTSFIPEEDKGFFMIDVQLPDAAALSRTEKVMDEITETLARDPAVENVLSANGFSLLNSAMQSNGGLVIVKLRPWDERRAPEEHQLALQKRYQQELGRLPGARSLVFGAPAIPGLGAVAGFSFVLEDTRGRGADELGDALQDLIGAASDRPEIARAFSTFRPGAPQIRLEVDRIKAKTLGVRITDVFATLQTQLGGFYVNDFNLFSQTFRVMAQADAPFRQKEEDLALLHVRNTRGELVPLSALVRPESSRGADVLYRHNTYNSATINGVPASGVSSGEAMDAMAGVASETMPEGFKYEWTASSFEERQSGNMAPIALGLSMVFAFLFLAALYESFLTPLAVMLSVPLAMIGALAGGLLAGEPLSLYGQIGLVLLVGLSAKTAVLIVEVAKSMRETTAMSLQEATVGAATLRFRAVMMTGLSFLAGVFPLVVARGAGAASRVSLGVAVFSGTVMSVIAGTLLVPIFFKLVQGLRERLHGGVTAAPE